MSWDTGETVTVRCPRCSSPVAVPVHLDRVDLQWLREGVFTVRTFFSQQVNVQDHECSDNLPPVKRFIETGHLDDPLRKD